MKPAQPLEEIIQQFIEEVRSDGKSGLWIHGPRRAGTSTCARYAVDMVIDNFPELIRKYGQGQRMTAVNLEAKQRLVWSQDALMRINGDDMSLWLETHEIVSNWEFMWNCSILFLDDIISPDTNIWNRHFLPRIDQRLKSDVITIFAGLWDPTKFGSDWTEGLSDLCKVYKMNGYHGGREKR